MVIGIGGVSRAGKTTLAGKLKTYYKKLGHEVDIFCQDQYVKPTISLTKVEGYPDWERPSTIKWDALMSAIERSTAKIKIVEGLFAFYPASLRDLYDLKVFMEIDRPTFDSRRSEDKRWDEEPTWYANHVWKSYMKYGQKKGAENEYVVVAGDKPVNMNKLASELNLQLS